MPFKKLKRFKMATFLIMIIQVEDALRDRVDKFETKVGWV